MSSTKRQWPTDEEWNSLTEDEKHRIAFDMTNPGCDLEPEEDDPDSADDWDDENDDWGQFVT